MALKLRFAQSCRRCQMNAFFYRSGPAVPTTSKRKHCPRRMRIQSRSPVPGSVSGSPMRRTRNKLSIFSVSDCSSVLILPLAPPPMRVRQVANFVHHAPIDLRASITSHRAWQNDIGAFGFVRLRGQGERRVSGAAQARCNSVRQRCYQRLRPPVECPERSKSSLLWSSPLPMSQAGASNHSSARPPPPGQKPAANPTSKFWRHRPAGRASRAVFMHSVSGWMRPKNFSGCRQASETLATIQLGCVPASSKCAGRTVWSAKKIADTKCTGYKRTIPLSKPGSHSPYQPDGRGIVHVLSISDVRWPST